MGRLTVLLAACVIASVPAGAETLQERVAAAQRRWAEIQELMESSDPIARSEGFNTALADENLGVRNNALWIYLHTRNRLPIEVVAEPGGRYSPGDLPNVVPYDMRWNAEQRTFEAFVTSFGGLTRTSGLVVAGKLQVRYPQLQMPDFVGQARTPPTNRNLAVRDCTLSLAVNAARDALEGRLVCAGQSEPLPVRMLLG